MDCRRWFDCGDDDDFGEGRIVLKSFWELFEEIEIFFYFFFVRFRLKSILLMLGILEKEKNIRGKWFCFKREK